MKITITGTPKEIADIVRRIKSQPDNENQYKPYIDVSTHKVTRHGIKINGTFYEFQDYLFYIGTFVNVIGGKVYGLDGKFLGNLSSL